MRYLRGLLALCFLLLSLPFKAPQLLRALLPRRLTPQVAELHFGYKEDSSE